MDVYRIEKSRFPVTLTMLAGERIAGDMFVQDYARFHTGPEWPLDILNQADPFFPFATSAGETLLIAKERVAIVEAAPPPEGDPERAAIARSAVVELRLTGGLECAGAVSLELPSDRPRLLDFLNRFHERFLMLLTPDGARFVNRRLIELVRPLD